MNKSELIDAIAADAGITKAAAKLALESFLGNVGATLKKGGRVSLVGFGSFAASLQKGKSGTVPGTTKKYITSNKMVPKFRPARILKDSVAPPK